MVTLPTKLLEEEASVLSVELLGSEEEGGFFGFAATGRGPCTSGNISEDCREDCPACVLSWTAGNGLCVGRFFP